MLANSNTHTHTPTHTRACKVAEEILSTEQSYCDSLQIVSDVFIAQLCDGKNAPIAQRQAVFINWVELLEFHTRILEQVEEAIEKKPMMIGACFNGIAPYMKPVYTQYTGNFDKAQAALQLLKKTPAVDQALRVCYKDPRAASKMMGLDAYLLEPIQRIPRYKMLLKEYVKRRQPEHPDYAPAVAAVEKVEQVAQATNGSIRHMENIEIRIVLQRNLPKIFNFDVMAPGRILLRHGTILKMYKKGLQPRRFYLFSDYLLNCSDTYQRPKQLELEGMVVEQVKETAAAALPGAEHYLAVQHKAEAFILGFDDSKQCGEWFDALHTAIDGAVALLNAPNISQSAGDSLGEDGGAAGKDGRKVRGPSVNRKGRKTRLSSDDTCSRCGLRDVWCRCKLFALLRTSIARTAHLFLNF